MNYNKDPHKILQNVIVLILCLTVNLLYLDGQMARLEHFFRKVESCFGALMMPINLVKRVMVELHVFAVQKIVKI